MQTAEREATRAWQNRKHIDLIRNPSQGWTRENDGNGFPLTQLQPVPAMY